MPAIDERVANVLDRPQQNDSDDEDALIAALEEDDDSTALNAMRERRLEQLHHEFARAKVMRNQEHGTHSEIKDEKQLMDITTSTKLCVVHFMKPDFTRCRIMEEKLRVLAEKHFDTRFVSIDVDNAPFLVAKLNLRVLPCVIAFKDGVSVDRLIGFEGIGVRSDTITAQELEARLLRSQVLTRAKMTEEDNARKLRQAKQERTEIYDEDEDWD